MAHTSMNHNTDPLHVGDLTPRQAVEFGKMSAAAGRSLLDLDGYVVDDALAAQLRAVEQDVDLTARIRQLGAELAELHERTRALITAADHEPAANEDEALALVDALADVRDRLRRTEEPIREATWHVEHLDVMPTTYGQGHVAGYAEAVERERTGDATSADDGATWFTASPGQVEVDQYERGFLAGFAEYFEGRA